jgi:hypothetical protein
MLRFSYYRSDAVEEWNLCGRLDGTWVDELRSVWQRIREHAPSVHTVVDLREVTFIDEAGEQLLGEMQSAGADLVARGVEHKHLLAILKNSGGRSLPGRIEYLDGGRR